MNHSMTTEVEDLTPLQRHALRRFAEQGFAATKLAHIAADAGIKPPSIYAHFKSKEELFLSLLPPAIEHELLLTTNALSGSGRSEKGLRAFLHNIGERFHRTHHLRFLIQASYLPPSDLASAIDRHILSFYERQSRAIRECFGAMHPRKLSPETLTVAYQGLVDSLHIAVLYMGGDTFETRFKALWSVFSISLREK